MAAGLPVKQRKSAEAAGREIHMPQIDLITGFLGSGKTTFIKKYARFLIDQGLTVGILENDYGAINIDMVLLEDLMGDNCDVEMIVGGDGIISHRRRFATKLISMAMMGFDRIIVEPSGIYDTDEFFDAMSEDPLCKWYTPGSLVAIVDAGMEDELSEESEYLLVSQTANAGKIVLSHCQDLEGTETPEETTDRILKHLNRALDKYQCDRRLDAQDILAKDWDSLTREDFASIAVGGMIPADHVKIPVEHENGYGTLFYFGTRMDEEKLRRCIAKTLGNPACGNVMRIKGFVRTGDDSRVQINATRRETKIEPTVFAREVLIVTGEDLHRDCIDAIWAEDSEIITPGA